MREFTEEHRKKLSEAHLGKKHTEKTKRKMSESMTGLYLKIQAEESR